MTSIVAGNERAQTAPSPKSDKKSAQERKSSRTYITMPPKRLGPDEVNGMPVAPS